ncbi:hypothetical protein B0H16DRAFT_1692413 [Mycena metata]|uniref:Fucose-specific lectin n=1 Tax=Mycena metata TaxID=1033252 RepID=A0AAD7N6C5_9AGAR|nr:hypothetical protein B0H16DRAFT_1692413 [Mycena metata]
MEATGIESRVRVANTPKSSSQPLFVIHDGALNPGARACDLSSSTMFPATILSVGLLAATATAQIVAPLVPQHPLIMNGGANGIYAFMYSNSSILELRSAGGPGNTAPLNTWAVNLDATAVSAFGLTNVAPSTYIAGYGYSTVQSSLGAVAQRIFYQTTNGNIVSAYHSGLTGSPGWIVDTTIATNLPLGTPISAFINVVSTSRVQLAVVHYTDAKGFLTSTFSSLDVGGWSTPITVQV